MPPLVLLAFVAGAVALGGVLRRVRRYTVAAHQRALEALAQASASARTDIIARSAGPQRSPMHPASGDERGKLLGHPGV